MGKLFSVDGKAYQFLEKVADCIIVSILWTLFSIPVVTIGAASTALYYTVHKAIRNSTGHVWRVFWDAFRSNFKQAALLWIIELLLGAFLLLDCYFAYVLSGTHTELRWILVILIVIITFVLMWSQYWFAYISHITDPIKTVLKNTFAMCILHFGKSLAMLAGLCVCIFLVVNIPIGPAFLVCLPGGYMYFASVMLKKVFGQYWDIEQMPTKS